MKHRMGAHEKAFKCLMVVLLGSLLSMMTIGSLWAWPWPDTGQTKCYNFSAEIPCPAPEQPFYGQDAQYQGPTRSYTKLGQNGVALADTATQESGWLMTRDNVTGLIWELKTDDNSINGKDKTFTWCDRNSATNGGVQGTCGTGTGNASTDTEAFIKALNDAHHAGFSDWRMPTIKELSSLVNSAIPYPGPTIDTAWFAWFPYTVENYYWSSTTNAIYTLSAWRVNFCLGSIGPDDKSYSYYVRAVRAGQSGALDHLVDNGDGTWTDTTIGLMWQQDTTPGTYTWQQALAYAEALDLAGHTDWRLPNRNELQSLVDYSRYYPAIDPLLAPYTVSEDYWSSTTCAYSTGGAQRVMFSQGHVAYNGKSATYYVRAVRAGPSGLLGHLIISTVNVTASWTLTGPNSFSQTGTGDQTLTSLAPGDYTLTWGNVNGWTKPSPASSTQTLAAGGTITFIGTYKKNVGLPWLLLLGN